ncbi:uncharacterized protein LOC116853462 [Odontomachus brunneus]|uniref:uncharacterized protein LOC116853462 n=1 Tax=Odontomachus brunneus TaxID=486640 RepID=UPI0013F1FF42|nr:uncharacterized protein LOC116853462 [Odontomachus brunneus]
MAEIWTRQQQLQRSIDRFLENFKKLGRSNLTAAKIRSRIAALRDLWQQFQSGNAVLLQSTPAAQQDAIEYFSGQCFDATEIYRTALDHLTEALEELEPPVSPQNDSAFNNTARINSGPLAQLPPINLPPFDGQIDHWESFRDRFTSLIIRNPELNNFARMHFLTTCVKGQALACILNLPVTAANFEIAWQALVSQYENKGRLLQRHLSSLLQLPAVTRESAVELQALRDQVKITLASLIHLPRSPSDLWSDMFIHLVVQRLDASSRKAWNLRVADHDDFPSFADLDRFLASRARAFDEIASAAQPRSNNRRCQSRQVSAATVSASSSQQCPICNSRHFFSACPTFTQGTPMQRRELVKKHGRCFNCLSRNHSAAECSSKYSCRTCQHRHHTLLHSSSTSAARLEAAKVVTPPTPSDGSRLAVQSLLASRSQENSTQILLATARVLVRGVDGRAVEVRALLDQGSEMTFISETWLKYLD